MDWRATENIIYQFALENNVHLEKREIIAVRYKTERFEFVTDSGLQFRLTMSKPWTEFGSSIKVKSPCKTNIFKARFKRNWLGQLKFKSSGDIYILKNIRQLTKHRFPFEISSDGKNLEFKTDNINLKIDTLRFIKQLLEEIKKELHPTQCKV